MHITRFNPFFQLTKNSKNLTFLFLPNANLNADFQKRIPASQAFKPRPRVQI